MIDFVDVDGAGNGNIETNRCLIENHKQSSSQYSFTYDNGHGATGPGRILCAISDDTYRTSSFYIPWVIWCIEKKKTVQAGEL